MKLHLTRAVIYLTPILSVGAIAQECRDLEDDSERLACYDNRESPSLSTTSPPETPTAAPDTDEDREQPTPPPAPEVINENTVLEERQREEQELFDNSFGIFPHRRSYILPFTYVKDLSAEPYLDLVANPSDEELDDYEVKFQYSFKVPLGHRFLFGNDQLYFAFTQLSLWQAYNSDISAPFRENNYEPELLWQFNLEEPLFNGLVSDFVLGLNHESNGRSGIYSRSWNRITFDTTWADEDWAVGLKLWYRLEESEDEDENPDIEDYLGYGQLYVGYKWDKLRFTGVFMNNMQSDNNRTSVDISFSIPISRNLRGFAQYYNGYGETLIDYNHRIKRIGFGVVLSDWF